MYHLLFLLLSFCFYERFINKRITGYMMLIFFVINALFFSMNVLHRSQISPFLSQKFVLTTLIKVFWEKLTSFMFRDGSTIL